MHTGSLCLAVCLALVIPARAADEKWQTFTSKEGRFSVALPGKPKEETKQATTPSGKKKEFRTFTLVSAPDRIYLVNYNDYPEAVVREPKNKETAFDAIRKGLGGKVVSEKKISVGKNKSPGRELLIELPMKIFYRARIFFVGKRLYQTVAMGADEFVRGKKADQFFDSFKVEE